jgi:hypothetical protein
MLTLSGPDHTVVRVRLERGKCENMVQKGVKRGNESKRRDKKKGVDRTGNTRGRK